MQGTLFDCDAATVSALAASCEPARASLQAHGFVVLADAFAPDLLAQVLAAVQAAPAADTGFVDLPIAGAVNACELFAQPFLLGLFEEVLGANFVLNSIGCELGGTLLRRDHRYLYPRYAPVMAELPPYAVSVRVPLGTGAGPTLVVGSHRDPAADEQPAPLLASPRPQLGGCTLVDYRTLVRVPAEPMPPTLVLTYCCRWFRGPARPGLAQGPAIDLATFDALPNPVKLLFVTTEAAGLAIARTRKKLKQPQAYGG